MLRYSFLTGLVFAAVFSSCNKVPAHARYIPKNAMAVVGLNTRELSKKLAWNVLIGSRLLDQMKAGPAADGGAANGLADAGIDALNTSFLYYAPSWGKGDYNYLTTVIPLSDASKWERYIQKNFNAPVKEINQHKEALLEDDLYAAWNDKMAIVRKVFPAPEYDTDIPDGRLESDSAAHAPALSETRHDPERLSADMQAAFTIQQDNDITVDKRFASLQTNGDDLTLWINYDVLMKNMSRYSTGMTGGLALGNSLWKGAAYAAGIHLDNGAVRADITYYLSEELKQVHSKTGNKHTDKDMIDRLPAQANLLAGTYIAPEGTKALLEKMGVLGFMSLALSQTTLTTDDVFQSFTGDMVAALSDFSVHRTADTAISEEGSPAQQETVNMSFLFAMKINDREKFNRLFSYVKEQSGLIPIDATTYRTGGGKDSLYISSDKGFMVISNKAASAKSFIEGSFTSQPKPDVVKKAIFGHPAGAYIDIQSFLTHITVDEKLPEQKELLDASKKLFKELIINGGEYKKEAFTYHTVLNLVNKEENSLLQLLDYSYKISNIRKKYDKNAVPAAASAFPGDESTAQN